MLCKRNDQRSSRFQPDHFRQVEHRVIFDKVRQVCTELLPESPSAYFTDAETFGGLGNPGHEVLATGTLQVELRSLYLRFISNDAVYGVRHVAGFTGNGPDLGAFHETGVLEQRVAHHHDVAFSRLGLAGEDGATGCAT